MSCKQLAELKDVNKVSQQAVPSKSSSTLILLNFFVLQIIYTQFVLIGDCNHL